MAEGTLMSLNTPVHDLWTFEDLQAIDDDRARRWEIVDGALVMTPSPRMRHESASARLRRVLDRAGAPSFLVVGPIAVDLEPTYRVPDLVIVSEEQSRTDVDLVASAHALLVVEVVSPSSQTTDRITKPAEYAAAGIPVYVRVETRPMVTITVYELAGTVYQHRGPYGAGQVVHLDHPFPVDIAVDDITP